MKEVLDSRFFATYFFSDDEVAIDATKSRLAKLRREGRGLVPSIVLAEVANFVCRKAGRDRAQAVLRAIGAFGLSSVPLDQAIATEAGFLRCTHRGVPLGDAVVAATAMRENALVVTDDPHFDKVPRLRTAWID